MRDLKTTNTLLLIIAIPVVFYLIKILSFILIPLVSSMFIALLFLPLMRWLKKRKVPKTLSILIVILIIAAVFKIGGELIQVSSKELTSNSGFFDKAQDKLSDLLISTEDFFGITLLDRENVLSTFVQKDNMAKNFGTTLDFVGGTISMILMTCFFAILWLAESMDFEKLLNSTILKKRFVSVKAFMKIERDLITFIKVKFLVSLFTGIGTGLACYFFGISFPVFWGLFAFIINFVQMVGSFITVISLSLFAFVEVDATGYLLFFILTITAVQAIFGGVLEPVFMGKSFSINIITILVMLMLWGYLWGVPGMIMSIPITVFLKIIMEQFPKTKVAANLMAGPEKNRKIIATKPKV